MIALTNDPVTLVVQGALHVITSDDQLRLYTAKLLELDSIEEPTSEEVETINRMSLLVETYEKERYAIPRASALDVLMFLMKENQLQPTDLSQEIGDITRISLVLSGQERLSDRDKEKLSERFKVSSSVFRNDVQQRIADEDFFSASGA